MLKLNPTVVLLRISYETPSLTLFFIQITQISQNPNPLLSFVSTKNQFRSQNYHLNAHVTFQLGLQPLDFQSNLKWHARRMSLLYCSLTGTSSRWYDRPPKVQKNYWSSFLQNFKQAILFSKKTLHSQLEALSPNKKDNEM